jgi:uncharacterized protein (DUF885 family)
MLRPARCALFAILLVPLCSAARSESAAQLGRDFFAWRRQTQPIGRSDVARVERPSDWVPDCSPAGLGRQRDRLRDFERRLAALPESGGSVSDSVDRLLVRSAVARARFELEVLRAPWRDPNFYVQQTLGAVFEALLRPPPFTKDRLRQILARLKAIPAVARHARTNLDAPVEPFARTALAALAGIEARMKALAAALEPEVPAQAQGELAAACRAAGTALREYALWLEAGLPAMTKEFAIGRAAYGDMLRRVALIPYAPEEILRIGVSEWNRSVAREAFAANRGRRSPKPETAATAESQIEQLRRDEESVRRFLHDAQVIDLPEWLGHYRCRVLPAYLEPLGRLGATDDLTSPSRRGEGALRYVRPPSPALGAFEAAAARDPRPLLVHEGIPGHFLQLSLAWSHPNPLRREHFDTAPIEGIGAYAEEMLLEHGFFDGRPGAREILCHFAKLRALRAVADVRLATGELTVEQAARLLEESGPMDASSALDEARACAASPGQALAGQVGAWQILAFLAEARRARGEAFQLKEFHNRLWREGNVPVALQRWEWLGLGDQVAELRK